MVSRADSHRATRGSGPCTRSRPFTRWDYSSARSWWPNACIISITTCSRLSEPRGYVCAYTCLGFRLPCAFQRAYTRLKRIHICDTHQHMLLQICLIVSHFPWAFGPYQRQMYMLARELSTRGHGLLWLSIAQQSVSAPDSFDHSFITFVDFNEPFVRTSKMNDIADKYHIDAYITLLDVERIIRDTDLKIPSIAWHPHHFNAWTPLDAYILRGFTTVASLDPVWPLYSTYSRTDTTESTMETLYK